MKRKWASTKFSIYASFKSKRNLFKLVLQHYEKEIENRFLGGLTKADSSVKDIKKFMNVFASAIYNQQIPGACLMVKTANELGKNDKGISSVVALFFDKMKGLFTRALANSQSRDEIGPGLNAGDGADYLVGVSQSLSVYSKMKSPKEIKNYIKFVFDRL